MVYTRKTVERKMFYGASKEIMHRAKLLRKNMTYAESLLWSKLKNKQLGVVFRRQHPIFIFIVDFYCHLCKLVIELDGEIHKDPEVAERDINRTAELERFGLTVIRFSNNDVYFQMEKVLKTIKKYIKQ